MENRWREALTEHYPKIIHELDKLVSIGFEVNEFRVTTEIEYEMIQTRFWSRVNGTKPINDIVTHLKKRQRYGKG